MTIEVNHFKNLTKKKTNAIFLGCGESINSLTKDEIDFINNNFDIWTSNNFMINSELIPDFYHMEIKNHRNGPLVSRLSKQRKDIYKNVNWIIDQTRPYILNHVTPSDYDLNNMYVYPKVYRKEEHGKYNVQEAVSVSCNSSLTVVADIILRQKYECLYLLGVDMNNSKYFWTDNKKYQNIKIEEIIKTCKPDERKPSDLHPTFKLQNYLPEFFEYNRQNCINLSSSSLLANKMITKSIKDVINEHK